MLSSVGATKRQRRSSVYYEAFVLLILALPVGIVSGIATIFIGMKLLDPYIIKIAGAALNAGGDKTVSATVSIHLEKLIMIVVIAAFTVFISCVLPARKAAKMGTINSIRESVTNRKKGNKTSRLFIRKRGTVTALAYKNTHLQKIKAGAIVRSIAIFVLVMLVTSYGANAVTKMVYYKLVEAVSVKNNLKDYDYAIENVSSENDSETYEALKKEIEDSPEVKKVRVWTNFMFVARMDYDVMSDEYWEQYRQIANAYYEEPFTKEAFYKKMKDVGVTLSKYAVDDETYQAIARKCGADMELAKDTAKNSVLFYQNLELSTDHIRFEDYKAKKYYFHQVQNATRLQMGENLSVQLYNQKTGEPQEFAYKIAGYAANEDLTEYITFHNGDAWVITSESTAKRMKQVMEDESDEDEEMYITLKNPDGEL